MTVLIAQSLWRARNDPIVTGNHNLAIDAEFTPSSNSFLADLRSVSITGLETWSDLSHHGEPPGDHFTIKV